LDGKICSPHEEMRNVYKIVIGNVKGRYHSEAPGADERIILEWISKN
jgi:hypothetical protein